jgi:hypothetical protein
MHGSVFGLTLYLGEHVSNAGTDILSPLEDRTMRSFLDAKIMAKSLRQSLADRQIELSHSDCLELVARQFGFREWNMLAARLGEIKPAESPLKLPKHWTMAGPAVNGTTHRLGLDPSTPGVALIESLVAPGNAPDLTGKIAVLMQSVRAAPFAGKRLRLTASLRTENADLGTIWLRIDGSAGKRFDNMMDRTSEGPLTGTGSWTARSIVLDVPEGAESVHYGFFLKGYGKVRAQAFHLETVGPDIDPTATHSQYLDRPSNLDFSV